MNTFCGLEFIQMVIYQKKEFIQMVVAPFVLAQIASPTNKNRVETEPQRLWFQETLGGMCKLPIKNSF